MEDAISEELGHLLLGYGFNYYRIENQLRADDLLVRQRAGTFLGQAAARLEEVAQKFQRTCMPTASREHPFPPADLMERLNTLRRVRQRVTEQGSLLQGMPTPTQDKIWQRLRNEQALLQSLLRADVALLKLAAEVEEQSRLITPEGWKSSDAGTMLDAALDRWEAAIRARQDLLLIQPGW